MVPAARTARALSVGSIRAGRGARIRAAPHEVRRRCEDAPKHRTTTTRRRAVSEERGNGNNESGDGDVYLVERRPLSEGIQKNTILIFVSDESGIINRVSGVFSRRGFNIESLAVGLNVDKAQFTVVVNASESGITNLVKQISKLVKVKYVEDVTHASRVERELMLIKVRAEAFQERSEVFQIAQVYRAKVVDMSETTVTLSATGDPGKTVALQQLLSRFEVLEVARTGKIAMLRGGKTIQGDSWNVDQMRDDLEEMDAGSGAKAAAKASGDATAEVVPGGGPAHDDDDDEGGSGDVYMLDPDLGPGIWSIGYMPEKEEETNEFGERVVRHTVSMLVADEPGVLQQVTSVFARRGYNIQSLAVGHAERKGLSRISLVVPGTPSSVFNLKKQLLKLVLVRKVDDLTDVPFVSRELMLIKCRCTRKQRREIKELAEIFRAKVCDIAPNTVTLEIEGKWEKMAALQSLLVPYNILEVARTGRIALSRESKVDSKYLEQVEMSNQSWDFDTQ